MSGWWRRFTGRTCPEDPGGRHDYRYIPEGATLDVQGCAYIHGQLMRCKCGSEYTSTHEVDEVR